MGSLRLVEVRDEVLQATGVVEDVLLDLRRRSPRRPAPRRSCGVAVALVAQDDREALVEEGHLLQPAADRLEVVGRWSRRCRGSAQNVTRAAGLPRGLALAQRAGHGARVVLAPDVPVGVDLHVERDGQRVHHGDADAVQAAGDRVGVAVELAAGVQDRHDDLDGGLLLHRVHARPGCRGRRRRRAPRRRPAASPRRAWRSRPSPRRRRCPRPPRSGGADRARRWSRCTCRAACAPPPGPRGP